MKPLLNKRGKIILSLCTAIFIALLTSTSFAAEKYPSPRGAIAFHSVKHGHDEQCVCESDADPPIPYCVLNLNTALLLPKAEHLDEFS